MTDDPATEYEAAADWFMRLRHAPPGGALRRDFERWLAQSDAHRAAFAGVERSWRLMGELPDAALLGTMPPARTSGRRPLMRSVAAGIIALAACIALFLAVPALRIWGAADYTTQTGVSRSVTLEDGTRVDLGADSALAVDITGKSRRARLLSGEAFFEVAPDAARPFVVDAGGVDIAVLGTAFNVRLSSSTTDVELAHGSVALDYPGHGGLAARLSPGQTALVDRDAGTLVTGEIAPDDIGAWRSGRLFVQDVTIGAVVEQIRRYHPAWITIPDGALAGQRVTGLYDLTDPDRALRALVQPHGGRVHALSPYLRVLARY